MPTRRLRLNDDILSQDVVEAIIAKEMLLKAGTFSPTGGNITSDETLNLYAVPGDVWSDSAVVFVRTYHTRASRQHVGIGRAYEKSVTQMRDANIGEDAPHVEEPVSESSFTYPADKVVNIQRGRKLNRRT